MSSPVYNGSDKRLQQLFQNGGGGGGGTTVVANPSGEATDELEKLQVGETIYDIPTGGGGSSTLAGLTDVELTSPTDGQVLTYNNGDWVNANGGGSGGSGGTVYMNTMYSTTEKKVGYWIDGKPLYQKSFTITQVPNRQLVTINHGIADIDEVTEVKGTCFANTTVAPNHASTMLPRVQDNSTNANMGIDVDRVSIILKGRNEAFSEIYDKIVVTIQYTKTTDSAEPHPQQGGVIYLPTIYSEEEREVGVWEDGKPLYQKTASIQNITISSNSSTTVNISTYFSSVDSIIDYECCNLNGEYIYPNIFVDSQFSPYSIGVAIEQAGDAIIFTRGNGGSVTLNFLFTLRYTKTTDTAGSGSWTPSGAPAIHYSTDEQIVGTWIDGKTLYQITHHIVLSSPVEPNTNTTITLPTITDAQVLFSAESVIGGFFSAQSYISQYGSFSTVSPSDNSRKSIIAETSDYIIVKTGNNYGNFPSAGADNRFREFWVTRRYTKSS